MNAKISQHVVPRRTADAFTSRSGRHGSRVSRRGFSTRSFERGSVDHATVTVAFGVLALLIVGFLGFFYLHQVVGTTSQGTDVRALESHIVELRERQRELELQGAELRSLHTVEERVNKLNLVAADRVTYLGEAVDLVASAH